MKEFKFFKGTKTPPRIRHRRLEQRRYMGGETGVIQQITHPTGILFYMEANTENVSDEDLIPTVSVDLRQESVTCQEFRIPSLDRWLIENRDNYIWCYAWRDEQDVTFTRYSDDQSIPTDRPIIFRGVIR